LSESSFVNPTRVNPTCVNPTSVNTTHVNTTHVNPTRVNPTSVNTTHVNPTRVNPTCVNPTCVNPTRVNPTCVNPTRVNPTRVNPSMMTREQVCACGDGVCVYRTFVQDTWYSAEEFTFKVTGKLSPAFFTIRAEGLSVMSRTEREREREEYNGKKNIPLENAPHSCDIPTAKFL